MYKTLASILLAAGIGVSASYAEFHPEGEERRGIEKVCAKLQAISDKYRRENGQKIKKTDKREIVYLNPKVLEPSPSPTPSPSPSPMPSEAEEEDSSDGPTAPEPVPSPVSKTRSWIDDLPLVCKSPSEAPNDPRHSLHLTDRYQYFMDLDKAYRQDRLCVDYMQGSDVAPFVRELRSPSEVIHFDVDWQKEVVSFDGDAKMVFAKLFEAFTGRKMYQYIRFEIDEPREYNKKRGKFSHVDTYMQNWRKFNTMSGYDIRVNSKIFPLEMWTRLAAHEMSHMVSSQPDRLRDEAQAICLERAAWLILNRDSDFRDTEHRHISPCTDEQEKLYREIRQRVVDEYPIKDYNRLPIRDKIDANIKAWNMLNLMK